MAKQRRYWLAILSFGSPLISYPNRAISRNYFLQLIWFKPSHSSGTFGMVWLAARWCVLYDGYEGVKVRNQIYRNCLKIHEHKTRAFNLPSLWRLVLLLFKNLEVLKSERSWSPDWSCLQVAGWYFGCDCWFQLELQKDTWKDVVCRNQPIRLFLGLEKSHAILEESLSKAEAIFRKI